MKNILSMFMIVCALDCSAQPRWISQTPPGFENDYFVASGMSAKSETEARQNAFTNAVAKVIQSGTITINGGQEIKEQSIEKYQNGQSLSLDVISLIENEIRVSGQSQTIKGLKEEETYTEYENGMYCVWILVKTPKRNPLNYSEPSKFASVLRSLVPSVEQFHKGQPTKGYILAGSTVSLVTSGFILSSLKTTADSDAKHSRTQAMRDYYNTNANTYNDISIACFIAMAAVYVYNIVDALATDGEKVYVDDPRLGSPQMSVMLPVCPSVQNLVALRIQL